MAAYPDTTQGATDFLAANALKHELLDICPDPLAEGAWLARIRYVDGSEAGVLVYIAGHPLAAGPFGGDFEVLD